MEELLAMGYVVITSTALSCMSEGTTGVRAIVFRLIQVPVPALDFDSLVHFFLLLRS